MRSLTSRLILLTVVGSFFSLTASGEELTDAKCRALQEELRPAKDEPWRTIPWKIGLLDAQRAATKEGMPILIWAMDGHPLGCT